VHQATVTAAAVLVVEVAAVTAVAVRIARRVVPGTDETLDRATVGLLVALVQVIGLLQLLGAIGLLDRWTVLVGHVALAAAILRVVPPAERSDRWRGSIALPTTLTASTGVVLWSLAAALSLRGPSQEPDTVQYHVPNAAWWLRTGSTWALPPTTPGYFTNAYPSNGELTGLWLMLPAHNDALASLAPLVFAVLCVCGSALLAKELRAPAWCGGLLAIAVLGSPVSFSTQVRSLEVDLFAAGAVVTAAALALRAVREPTRARWVVLAGLSVGVGIGAKDTALVPGLAVLALMVVLMPRGRRLAAFGTAVGAAAALSGFWFVRDWVDTGNPIFPQGLVLGGHRILQGARGPLTYYRTTLLQHLEHGDTAVIGRWTRLVAQDYGPAALVLLIGLATSVWMACGGRRRRVLAVLIVVCVSVIAYLATPYTGGGPAGVSALVSSQLRYALPAALLAVGVAATLPGWAIAAIAVPALGYDGYRALQGPGFRHDLTPHAGVVAVVGVLVVALMVGWLALARDGGRFRDRGVALLRRRVALSVAAGTAGAGLLVVCCAFVLAGVPRLSGTDALAAVLGREGRPGGPVVLLGSTDVRPVLGPDLRRDVVSIGGGGAVHEIPLRDAGQLDARIRQLAPAAVVVGSGGRDVPPGWVSPAGWSKRATMGDFTIYAPAPSSP
jgi:hypothetical protein